MTFISENNRTVQTWGKNGLFPLHRQNGISGFYMEELAEIPEVKSMLESKPSPVRPAKSRRSVVTPWKPGR